MSKEQPLISIIVPAYNAEKTIRRCIESICATNYNNKEIIVVNDGSKDGTLDILNDLARRFIQLIIIDKENGGVSSARNAGLDKATGEFVVFVDSDDYVDSNLLDNYDVNCSSDMQIQGYNVVDNYGNAKKREELCEYEYKNMAQMIYEIERQTSSYIRQPWNKLYRRSVIERYNIRFCESMPIAEDFLFNLCYIEKSNTVKLVNGASYNYIIENSTLTKIRHSPVKFLEWVINVMKQVEIICKDYNDVRAFDLIFAKYSQALISMIYVGAQNIKYSDKQHILQYIKMYLTNDNLKFIDVRYRIIFILRYSSYRFADYIFNIYFSCFKLIKKHVYGNNKNSIYTHILYDL